MGAFYCDCMEFMEYRNFVIHGGNSEGKEGLINSVVGYVEEIKSEKTTDRKSTRLNSSHNQRSRMPSSA